MIKILNAEPLGYSSEARGLMCSIGNYVELKKGVSLDADSLKDVDVLIVRLSEPITKNIMGFAPSLKVIVSATTGLDHIDLKEASARDVVVLSLRGETEFLKTVTATAELTWGLLLATMRKIVEASHSVINGVWNRDNYVGCELYGKSLAIIGLGRLGEQVARYGLAFGMDVKAFDPYRDQWIEGVKRASTLREAVSNSDVVSIHVPLNSSTKGMFDEEVIQHMKSSAILVNTSRGEIIDESALLSALSDKRLGGAALDVISEEWLDIQTNDLVRYACQNTNLIVTPHIGGATYESMARTEVFMAEKLATYLETKLDKAT